MKRSGFTILFLALCVQLIAQPIYRRGGFQFVFTSDSVLTSDHYYALPSSGKKIGFALPAQVQGMFIQNNGKLTNSAQVNLFPTFGYHHNKLHFEAYLGVGFDNNAVNNPYRSMGFGQKPVDIDSSANRSYFMPGGVVRYDPNAHFSFAAGFDKNFIGEGYHSLFLSDNASNAPFVKASTAFWKVKYSILFNALNNIDSYQAPFQLRSNKFTATHMISVKPTKWLEVLLFESIVWQSKDSLNSRGFDFNYLNPVVFFRPVEYSLGSPDNAMLGGGINLRFAKNFMMYSQVMLDEFLLSEVRAQRGWWANKFGAQGGFKWYNALNVEGLNLLGEVNVVRPFTYTHKSNLINYGHNYSAIAHPWGANFYQMMMIAQYQKGKHRFVLQGELGEKGYDYLPITNRSSYGGNIFVPYTYRNSEYGNELAQGDTKTIMNGSLLYGYTFSESLKLEAFGAAGLSKFGNAQQLVFRIGVRTPIFNSYANF